MLALGVLQRWNAWWHGTRESEQRALELQTVRTLDARTVCPVCVCPGGAHLEWEHHL